MAKDLSEGIRGQIIALRNEGYSQWLIAVKIGVLKGAVQRTLRGSEKQSYSTLPRSGRPRCATPQEDQFVKITSLCNRTATAGNIQSWINAPGKKQSAKQQ
jgi:IS30 family transposase